MCIDEKKLLFILSDYSFKGRELVSNIFVTYMFSNLFLMQYRLYPPVSLFMVCKESYNLCMNRASLDCESLDRVS